jgi:hypothetical protein
MKRMTVGVETANQHLHRNNQRYLTALTTQWIWNGTLYETMLLV